GGSFKTVARRFLAKNAVTSLLQSYFQDTSFKIWRVPKISDDVTIGGRGVVARSSIPASDSCLLSVDVNDPRLVITPARALRLLNQCSCTSRKLWATPFTTSLEPQDVLVVFFLHIKLAASSGKCDLWRIWRTYFDMLPETFSDVAYISSHEPAMFAKILPLLPMSMKYAFSLQVQKMKNSYKRIFGNSGSETSELDFSWAWSVVNSRCVYVNLGRWAEGKDLFPLSSAPVLRFRSGCNANIAIVPFFDFFNHSPHVSVSIEVTDGILRLKTNTHYQPGEQVFINYGSHDNLFLLCEYGFCIPGEMNPCESIYPTYRNLLSITQSPKKLQYAIANLQLDVPAEKTEDTRYRHWMHFFVLTKVIVLLQ
uniref:SET domain-containing protein n=1 Tax=Mesocestoides corti TaxID=53468 RepID=A0A5K3EQB4_MESCO